MSTHVPGFQSFFKFFASFCIGKISHSSMRVKHNIQKHDRVIHEYTLIFHPLPDVRGFAL